MPDDFMTPMCVPEEDIQSVDTEFEEITAVEKSEEVNNLSVFLKNYPYLEFLKQINSNALVHISLEFPQLKDYVTLYDENDRETVNKENALYASIQTQNERVEIRSMMSELLASI